MSLWKIAWKSIRHRSLASGLTAFSMALGVALVVAVLVIHGVIDKSFRRSSQGYDLIVGPKGSKLELVLNTVYHLGKSPGTIPYEYYTELYGGRFAPEVEIAIPVCVGGNVDGHRVIGTTGEMFSRLEYMGGKRYTFDEGRNFKASEFFSAVIGATAAKKTDLKVGDEFRPVHGEDDAQGEEHEPFTIVGILDHTGTPNDQALFVNIEGFFLAHAHSDRHEGSHDFGESDEEEPAGSEKADDAHDEHDHADAPDEEHSGHDHDEALAAGQEDEHAHDEGAHGADSKRLTAVLVLTTQTSITTAHALPTWIGEEMDAQAVAPAEEITRLFEGLIGNIQLVLMVLAVLIVVVAGIGILVSIYNSMSDRRHEIAIMRALGARRQTVLIVILLESILLSLGGGAFGMLLGHGLVGMLGPWISEYTGVIVNAAHVDLNELILIPGLILLASVVGFLPAVIAYRTDVAQSLAP